MAERSPLERLEEQSDRFLLREYISSPESLAVVRIVTALWLLLMGMKSELRQMITPLPNSFWDPPLGPARLLDGPPPGWFLGALSITITVALVLLFAGFCTSAASAVAGTSLLAAETIENSFGKIDHGLILLPVFLILMTWSGWGASLSVDAHLGRRPSVRAWPIALTMLLLSVMMAMAALPKLRSGWLDLSFSAAYQQILLSLTGYSRDRYLAGTAANFRYPTLWELTDWATVLFEFAFVALVWRRSWFRGVLVAAALFHLGVLLILNIAAVSHVFVYAAAFDWSTIGKKMGSSIGGSRAAPAALLLTGSGAALIGQRLSIGPLLQEELPLFVAGTLASAWMIRHSWRTARPAI